MVRKGLLWVMRDRIFSRYHGKEPSIKRLSSAAIESDCIIDSRCCCHFF